MTSFFSHQSEPQSKSSRREHCSLSQPGSQETKSQPQFSLARHPQHVTLPPLKSLHAPLSQPRAMQSTVWQGSAGLTVPRQLREGSDFVLVRRTGKGRQQRVKTGFLTPAAPDKACGYPCPKGKGQAQSRPTSLNLIPQNPATAWLLNTILEAGGSKASVFSSCHHQDFQGRAGLAWDTSLAHGCHPSPSSCWLGGGETPDEQRKGFLMERNILFSTQMSDCQEGGREAYGGDANQILHGPQGTLWSRQKGCWPQEQHTTPPSQEMLLYFLGRLPGS